MQVAYSQTENYSFLSISDEERDEIKSSIIHTLTSVQHTLHNWKIDLTRIFVWKYSRIFFYFFQDSTHDLGIEIWWDKIENVESIHFGASESIFFVDFGLSLCSWLISGLHLGNLCLFPS